MMNRRKFLGLCAVSSAVNALPSARASTSATPVSVLSFGADPTGAKDSTDAVRRAIAHLPAEGGVLDFPKGTYRFAASEEQAFELRRLRKVTVRGNGSALIFNGATKPFFIDEVDGLRVENLSIDWARLPYSQGIVTEVGDKSFVIRIDADFPVTGKEPIQAIGDYDRAKRRPMVNGIDSYHSVSSVSLVGPQTLRVNLKSSLPVTVGSILVLRHLIYDVHGFVIHRSSKIEFSQVDLFAMPGFGVLAVNSTDLSFDQFRTILKPETNRLMSLCADSIHITDCSGIIDIHNCAFQGMGDDAINICAAYYIVSERVGPRALAVKTEKNTAIPRWRFPVEVGTMQICDRATQVVRATAAIAKATEAQADSTGAELIFASDLPSSVMAGDIVCGTQDQTQTTIRNSTFTGNRARGILIHKNAEITGNTFDGCSLAAILMAADSTWLEGPVVDNVRIAKNHFNDCYYAHANDRRGTITLDTAHDRAKPMTPVAVVNRNVTIADNTFVLSPGAAVYCAGVDGLELSGNDFGESESMSQPAAGAVVLRNDKQVMVKENRTQEASVILAIDCQQPVHENHNERMKLVQTAEPHEAGR